MTRVTLSSPIKRHFPSTPIPKKITISLFEASEDLVNWQNGEQLNTIIKGTKRGNFLLCLFCNDHGSL